MTAALFGAIFLAAALLGYRRPAWGVAALLFFDPFVLGVPLWRTTITSPKVMLLGFALGLLARRVSLAPLWAPRARPLLIGALALIAANALSIVPSEYIDTVARETLKACEYALAFALCLLAIADDADDLPVRAALIAGVAAVALGALAQEFGGAPSAAYIAGRAIPRIAGALEGPNQLAAYLGIALPVLIAYAVGARSRLAAAVSALAFFALVLTLSRAGILAGIIGVATVAVVLRGARPRLALLAAGAVAALVGLVVAGLGGLPRLIALGETGAPNGLATRPQLWHAAIELWKRSPLLGIGAGNFELSLGSAGLEGVRTHANSQYLQALVEGGVPLLAATLWTAYASIATFARARSRDPLVAGVFAGSVALALHQVLDCLTFYPKVGGFWWMLLGIALGRMLAAER